MFGTLSADKRAGVNCLRRLFRWRVMSVVAMGVCALALWAQNPGGSALLVQVNPEAHLDPPAAQLSFQVTEPGELAASQPVTITAWVRALPNQQIRLTAQPAALNGPGGAVPLSAVLWNGAMLGATGGATAAACTSGDFSSGQPGQMIAGWNQSGIAKCTVTFRLQTETGWPEGLYTGRVELSLLAQ